MTIIDHAPGLRHSDLRDHALLLPARIMRRHDMRDNWEQ